MAQVTSVSDTAYAYLATLSRLDTNGDGVLSRGERAADEKPGILAELSEEPKHEPRSTATDNVLALMMGMRTTGTDMTFAASNDDGSPDLYRSTYGQYDLDIAS
ncbi:hypothetical protein [Rhizobium sp. BE258]|jgi:hypothetical protein|uniref:hypothetical protein n=1 Tax=Rhizobium sp. BE258 TaxID=2817722 RepID=UPI000DD78F65|nr:hypothetical protein [Rhizobium sp. BE258]MDR7146525.1 hypothetical protein [Rhizobium sp. BE258]